MRSAFLLLLVGSTQGLPDTKIKAEDSCTGAACLKGLKLGFPKTVYPVTPRFDFDISGSLDKVPVNPVFDARGSLGLPNHPLGIFGFNTTGPACGKQTLQLMDGVLATITVDFPECPWSADVDISGHVDVWTTLPAIEIFGPIGLSTGFTLFMQVSDATNSSTAGPEHLNLRVDLAQPAGKGADPKQDNCTLDMDSMDKIQYPPQGENYTIPTYTINLDLDPKDRWDHVVRPLSKEISAMIQQFIDSELHPLEKLLSKSLVRFILDLGTEEILKKVPAPFDDEIRGIAKSTGLPVTYIFVYNIMYELMGLCTSIVAEDADGHIYHARNLDFGLFMGSDATTHNWALTAKLRPLLMNLNFVREGVLLYQTTQFAGYIGLLTGIRRGGFTISVDSRFDGHLDKYLIMFLLGKYEGNFLSLKTRTVMENFGTYSEALNALTHWKPIGPCYIILGGAKSKEGAVIQLGANRDTPLLVRSLADKGSSNYVVQTNYDWPAPPPAFDDRRYPVMDCLNKLGSVGINYQRLWGVMSSTPTRNALTTYTSLMSAETGYFESYKQFCAPGPNCSPFMAKDYAQLEQMQSRPVEFIV